MRLARSATIHVLQALLEAAIVASLVVVLIAGTAFAAKGGGGGNAGTGGGKHGGGSGTSTLQLVMVTDQDVDGIPDWGDTVTFKITTTATTSPYVSLTCSQGGTLVYSTNAGFFAGYPWPWTTDMTLVSQAWVGGAAACSARLYYLTGSGSVTLATLGFSAGA